VALGAGPAQAAFPGRNGLLAVQGVSGHGVVFVQPSGAAVHTICSQTLLCGNAQQARWSPDGRYITFVDAATSKVEVVATDGTCMWCLLGRPLTPLRGTRPAFAPDGQSVTFAGGRAGTPAGLWRVGLTTGLRTRIVSGPVSGAAWSSTGELAVVRRAGVWILPPGRRRILRRLATGSAPSWSPDGSKLAISRGGWVSVVELKSGHVRRLAPGAVPAWSPDGHQIAYIGPGDVLRVMAAGGGGSRSLGVQARSVDWQPVPPHGVRTCTPPRGSTVLASNAESIISSRRVLRRDYYAMGWFGCLRGIGTERLLQLSNDAGGESSTYVTAAFVAGRFALLSTEEGDKYGGCFRGIDLSDLAKGASTGLFSQDCADNFRFPTIGSLALDSSGFAAWRGTHQVPLFHPLNGIDCPSISFCVAVDGNGNVVTSTNPTGGRSAWSFANVDGTTQLSSVSCPALNLCVAATNFGGNVLTSTDPAGGPSSWTRAHVDDLELAIFLGDQVSCPSVSLCVMADDNGNVVTSTDPTGGGSAWTVAHVNSNNPPAFTAISCPSTSLCVALDDSGSIVTSSNPTGGASAWSGSHVGASGMIPPVGGVSCPSVSLCIAVDGAGDALTSTNPTGGASAWSVAKLAGTQPVAVSCPSSSLCVAVDVAGNVVTSTDPTGGASSWQIANVDGTNRLTAVSCPSVTRCVATDAKGNVLTSDDPLGGAPAWTSAAVDVPDCAVEGTPCIVEQLFARDDHGTRVIDSTAPGAGKSIGNVTLQGNSTVLSWTHDGLPREAPLG
jgi:hypothetical protein